MRVRSLANRTTSRKDKTLTQFFYQVLTQLLNIYILKAAVHGQGWLPGTAVERRSLTGELSLSCALSVAAG